MTGTEKTGETKRVLCARCRQPYDSPAAPVGRLIIRTTRYCPDCTSTAAGEFEVRERDAAVEAQREIFRGLCPPLYRRLMRKPEFRRELYQEIVAADPRKTGLGVLLWGESGRWKTTCMWRFIADLIQAGHRVIFETGPGLKERVLRGMRDRDLDRQRTLLAMAQYLFLDDLGQAADSPAAGEFLLSILELRTSADRPTLVTSNFGGAAFASSFNPPERGAAIARRLHDYCTIIAA